MAGTPLRPTKTLRQVHRTGSRRRTKSEKLARSKFARERLVDAEGGGDVHVLIAIFSVDTRHLTIFPGEHVENGKTSVPDDGHELPHETGATGEALVVNGDICRQGCQESIIRIMSLVRQPAAQLREFVGVR